MQSKTRTTQQKLPGLLILTAFLALSLILAACQSTPTETESPETPLSPTEAPPTEAPPEEPESEPTEAAPEISQPIARWYAVSEQGDWVLVGYGEALNPTVVEPGTYVTINFSATDDQVNGSGSCNNYFTTYSADDDGNLTINGPIGSTMMACEVGMEQESLFFSALETVTGYEVTEDGRLVLQYDNGAETEEQLVFDPAKQLIDTLWVLNAYGDANNPTPSQPGVTTTALFSADGTVSGSAGCNQYSAGFTVQEGQFSITAPTSTRMACETGMEQESAYLTALENAETYSILGSTLELTYGGGAGVLRFSARHLSLENVRWVLSSVDGQSLPFGVEATAMFTPGQDGAENELNGNAGCNGYFGTYTVAGNNLEIGTLGATQMMCDEQVMEVESAFLAGLESAQSYQTILNQLTITTSSGEMIFFADRAPLEGILWTLTSLGPVDNPRPPVEGANITATFSRQSGMPSGLMSGNTGCNEYASAYYANPGDMWINMPGTSNESCTPDLVGEELVYFQALDAAHSYRILGNELQIFFDNQVLNFVVTTPPAETGPLAPLDGTQWWLYSLDSTQVIPGSEITALFAINADGLTGTISGSAGCNDYNTEIVDLFQVSGVNATQSLCEEPEGIMEQESAYLAALETSQEIAWDGGTLRINTQQGTLVYGNAPPSPDQPTATPEETQEPIGGTPTDEPTEEGTPESPTETPSTEPTEEGTPESPTDTPEASQPVAVISAPSEAQVDQMVTLDGSGSTPQDGIMSYLWDYGDGTEPVEGLTVQHAYRSAGTYTITLSVRDANGQTDITTQEITIN
jgi:heat shock protein HslJ